MPAQQSALFGGTNRNRPKAPPRPGKDIPLGTPSAVPNAVSVQTVAPHPFRYVDGTRGAGLTPVQKAIAVAMGKGMSITAATKAVGCTPNTGYRAASDPKVQAFAREELARNESSVEMTRQRVMDGYLEAIEMAKVQADPLTMVRGWTEVAKMCGYFAADVKKIEISLSAKRLVDKMEQMSDADLLKYADPGILDAVFTEIRQDPDNDAPESSLEAPEDAETDRGVDQEAQFGGLQAPESEESEEFGAAGEPGAESGGRAAADGESHLQAL